MSCYKGFCWHTQERLTKHMPTYYIFPHASGTECVSLACIHMQHMPFVAPSILYRVSQNVEVKQIIHPKPLCDSLIFLVQH